MDGHPTMLSMESEPAEDHCPHCGPPLYPSHEEKLRRASFYSQLAAIIVTGGHDGACRGVAAMVVKRQAKIVRPIGPATNHA
jgi:hypothetical protein